MLESRLKPSLLALLSGAFLGLLCLLSLFVLPWTPLLKCLLALPLLFFFYRYYRRDIALIDAKSDDAFRLQQGRLRRRWRGQWQQEAAVDAVVRPLPGLIIISLHEQRPLLLWRDAVTPQYWRQLLVFARFGASYSEPDR
jgi:hypothetical protein